MGAIKYADEAAVLAKHGDEVRDDVKAIHNTAEAADAVADTAKQADNLMDTGGELVYNGVKQMGSYVVAFDVPVWFDELVRENSVLQKGYKTNPLNQGGTAPKITDLTTPGYKYELPSFWIEWLEEYAANARIKSIGDLS